MKILVRGAKQTLPRQPPTTHEMRGARRAEISTNFMGL